MHLVVVGDGTIAAMKRRAESKKQVFVVYPDDEGQALARFVGQRCGLDEAGAQQRLRAGSVFIDGKRQQASVNIRAGQKITVFSPTEHAIGPSVVYRDEQIAVIDKPAGVPSTLPRSGARVSVEGFIAEQLSGAARLMHRLDMPASGLLVVSLRQQTRAALARQITEHVCERRYLALVAGKAPADQWCMSRALSFDGHRARLGEGTNARSAETTAKQLRSNERHTLLQLELRTGRTHQIRAHLAGDGLPIVGDERYGGPAAARLALHAHQLSLAHPVSGQLLDFHSPMPAGMRALLVK